MDAAGRIYAAGGSGERAGLYVFGPGGEPLAFVKMPGDSTHCAFGEPALLYITGQGPEVPGRKRRYGLFRIRLATGGEAEFPPRGRRRLKTTVRIAEPASAIPEIPAPMRYDAGR